MTQQMTNQNETPTFTMSSWVPDSIISTVVDQVYRHFRARDWLDALDNDQPGARSRFFMPECWDDYAMAVVDKIVAYLPDICENGNFCEVIQMEDLGTRFDEFDALPKEWWHNTHPMSQYLAEYKDEFTELSKFFDKYGEMAERLELETLHEMHCLDDLVVAHLRNVYDIDLDLLPSMLLDSIDDKKLQKNFLEQQGIQVEFNKRSWILVKDA